MKNLILQIYNFRNVYKDHQVSKKCVICTKRKLCFNMLNNNYGKRTKVNGQNVYVSLGLKTDLEEPIPNKIPKRISSNWKIKNPDSGRFINMTPVDKEHFKMHLDICEVNHKTFTIDLKLFGDSLTVPFKFHI